MTQVIFDLDGHEDLRDMIELGATWSQIRGRAAKIVGCNRGRIHLTHYGNEIKFVQQDTHSASIVDGDLIEVSWPKLKSHPLHEAAHTGNLEAVKRWLSYGVPVDIKSPYGTTPLMFAAHKGNREVVSELLLQGANFKFKNDDLDTPLHWAALMGNWECVDLFISLGANISDPNSKGLTPIDNAKSRNRTKVVLQLEVALLRLSSH